MKFVLLGDPKTKRARQRVAQHGEKMQLVQEAMFRGVDSVFVSSLGNSAPCEGVPHKWVGWFSKSDFGKMEII